MGTFQKPTTKPTTAVVFSLYVQGENELTPISSFFCVTSLMSFKSSAILKALVSDCHNFLTILQILILQKGSSFFFVTILLGKLLESINCDSKVLEVPKEHLTSSVKLLKQPKCGRQQKHSFTDCSVYDCVLWKIPVRMEHCREEEYMMNSGFTSNVHYMTPNIAKTA